MKLFVIVAFVVIMITMTIVHFHIYDSYHTNTPLAQVVQMHSIEKINYNEINQEVINLEKQYFEINDRPIEIKQINLQQEDNSSTVTLGQWSLSVSNKNNNITVIEEIRIDTKYVRTSDVYRTVFTHEYLHHILYLMNFSDSDDSNEGLTEAFVWYTNKETQTRLFGEHNEQRQYPYTLVMNQIFQQDNFVCLDKVFVKDNKIKSVNDYKTRLKDYCNVTI
jgi:hypothetical protein